MVMLMYVCICMYIMLMSILMDINLTVGIKIVKMSN